MKLHFFACYTPCVSFGGDEVSWVGVYFEEIVKDILYRKGFFFHKTSVSFIIIIIIFSTGGVLHIYLLVIFVLVLTCLSCEDY